jgi:hypothetical protein
MQSSTGAAGMSDGYHQKLAEILRKAQGVTDAETGKAIDVGGEVMWLRKYCDKQHSGMVSGWLTIDKPPTEEDGYVLVWAENMPVSVGCCEEDYYIFTECSDLHNYFEGDVNWLKEHWSHWMPLPDPKSKQHSGLVSVPVELLEKVLFNSCHLPEKYQDELQAVIDKAAQE